MASIRKLASGKYQACIYCGKDADGKSIRKYITKNTLSECKQATYEFEHQIKINNMR